MKRESALLVLWNLMTRTEQVETLESMWRSALAGTEGKDE